VRVQARQLRFKLAEYFSGEGRSDPIRIELPKGSYVPIFSVAALDAIQRIHDASAEVFALAGLGRRDEARERIAALTPDVQARVPYYVACLHAAAGDTDLAFAWLKRAYESRQTDIVSIKVDPQMDALRGDPRFAELLRRIGLADSSG
jgi:hypothetical protein